MPTPTTCLAAALTLAALAGCSAGSGPGGSGSGQPGGPSSREVLASLPYLAGVAASPARASQAGVVRNLVAEAAPGFNLYTSKRWTEARLVDQTGRLVHRWHRPPEPPLHPTLGRRLQAYLEGWMHVELAPGGDLFVIQEMHSLARLDRSSRVLWRAALPAHHDLAVGPDGRVWVLAAAPRRELTGAGSELFLDNLIVGLGPDGQPVSRRSLLETLRASPETTPILARALERRAGWSSRPTAAAVSLPTERERQDALPLLQSYLGGARLPERLASALLYLSPADVLHCNTLEILPRDLPGVGKRGDFLIAVRNLDLLVVVGAASGRVLWHWGPGVLDQMHQPTVLPSGNILVFDNGANRGFSRLLEIDPGRRQVVWSWQADPPKSFFSAYMGGVEALANGNLLVTDSLASRAFELTRAGKIVWDYYEPALRQAAAEAPPPPAEVAGDPGPARTLPPRTETVTIYRMARLPLEAGRGWLAGPAFAAAGGSGAEVAQAARPGRRRGEVSPLRSGGRVISRSTSSPSRSPARSGSQ